VGVGEAVGEEVEVGVVAVAVGDLVGEVVGVGLDVAVGVGVGSPQLMRSNPAESNRTRVRNTIFFIFYNLLYEPI
jgi:hypothetical protein